jgi:hypothetical protein
MEGDNLANNFALYLMLIICLILVSVDGIEIYRVILSWQFVPNMNQLFYESCIKSELLTKTVFAVLSILSKLCALILTLSLIIDVEYFLNKMLPAYLNMVYSIFGPIMLGFSVIALLNWNDIVYICDKSDYREKYFSFGNAFSVVGCFVVSLFITITFAVYESVNLYIASILGREGQNKPLRSIFWWVVMRARPNLMNNQENNNQVNNPPNNQNV